MRRVHRTTTTTVLVWTARAALAAVGTGILLVAAAVESLRGEISQEEWECDHG